MRVRLTREAEAHLKRPFDFVLQRELEGAAGDFTLAEQAMGAIRAGFTTLRTSRFTCRKAGDSPFLRKLIIPLGRSAYVAPFEIESATGVVVLAVRHQLEDDYHRPRHDPAVVWVQQLPAPHGERHRAGSGVLTPPPPDDVERMKVRTVQRTRD